MGKRWIPKIGETVTLDDGGKSDVWTGPVLEVTKSNCLPGQVYLSIGGKSHGWTVAYKNEITIHP